MGAGDGGETSLDEKQVPVSSVLFEQQEGFSIGADAGSRARNLYFHEGYEAMDLEFIGGEFGKDTSEA